jgi:amino acid permease
MFNLKIFFYIIFILILVYLFIDKAIHHKLLFPSKKLLFGDFHYENYIYGFSIILFFMTFQKIIFEVYVLMKSRKNKNMIKSTKKGLLISIYMFIFLGTLFTITLNGSYETYTEFLFKEITGINKLLYKVFLASILSTVLIFFIFSYFNNFVRLRKQFYSLFLYRKKHELFEYKTTKEFTEIKMENVKMKHEKIKLSFCDKIFVTFLMIIFISIMINYSNKIIVLITFFGAFSSNIIILFLPTSYLIILNNVKIFSKEMIVEKIIMLIGLFILCFIIYIYITFMVNKFI